MRYNRSYLMVPGDKERFLEKLDTLGSDFATINLEDGVYDKNFARSLVGQKLKNRDNSDLIVRINSFQSCGKEDIEAINPLKPKAIRIPKVQSVQEVQLALDLIDSDIEVHLTLETKEGLALLPKLKIDPRVTTVFLGILDLLESMGLPQNLLQLHNPTIEYILAKFLVESKTAGLHPVSFIYQEYQDLEGFKKWCIVEKKMGFTSKGCTSPGQVKIVNEVFSLDKQTIAKARYIKEVFEKQHALGCSGFSDDRYGFIDEPIYRDALLVLATQPN